MIGYKYLADNPVTVKGVVHVGGHRGEELSEHSALGASKIIWIEANPDVYTEMITHLSQTKTNVQNYLFNALCYDRDGEQLDFNIVYGPDADYMVGNKGCSSILKPIGRFEAWWKQTLKLDTITLDSLMKKNGFDFDEFDLLEIDTQGAELFVLKGATELLKSVKYVSIEVTDSEPDYEDSPLTTQIIEFMSDQNFKYIETKYLANTWGDALFIKNSI